MNTQDLLEAILSEDKELVKEAFESIITEKAIAELDSIKESVGISLQIDELSKDTLKSYIKKASGQAFVNGLDAGGKYSRSEYDKAHKSSAKGMKRTVGVAKAVDKLVKEDSENQGDE